MTTFLLGSFQICFGSALKLGARGANSCVSCSALLRNPYFHFDRVKSLWRELDNCQLSFLTAAAIFSRIFFEKTVRSKKDLTAEKNECISILKALLSAYALWAVGRAFFNLKGQSKAKLTSVTWDDSKLKLTIRGSVRRKQVLLGGCHCLSSLPEPHEREF